MQYDALSSGITLHCILLLWISKLICKLRAVRTPRKKICALIFKSQQIWSSNNNYKKRLLILRVPKAHINPCGLAIPLHTRFRKAGLLTALPHATPLQLYSYSTQRRKQDRTLSDQAQHPLSLSLLWNVIILLSAFQYILTFQVFLSSQACKAKGTPQEMLLGWEHTIPDQTTLISNSGSAVASSVTCKMGTVTVLTLLGQ